MKFTMKTARINAGYNTQELAAEALGVTKDTISNWERGKTYPDVPQLKKIEEIYGVSYNDIIFLTKNNGLVVKGEENNTK